MEKVIKTIETLAPFLAAYPLWVKALFSVLCMLGLILFLSLVLAKPPAPKSVVATETAAKKPVPGESWLVIKGVRAYELQHAEGLAVRVIADVNGIEFVYPSGTQAKWLEIGPNMSPQKFRLPSSTTGYEVSFKMVTKYQGQETYMISQWKESIKELPFEGEYNLHDYHPASDTRSGTVSATVIYALVH